MIDAPFRLEGSTRIDQKPAHKSIREALVNTIIHAAYGSNTRIVIKRFPNEIVFSNPGTMLVSQRQFFAGVNLYVEISRYKLCFLCLEQVIRLEVVEM